MLEIEWKAGHAVRDDILVQKLCWSLEDILGNIPLAALAAGAEYYLLTFKSSSESPQLTLCEAHFFD